MRMGSRAAILLAVSLLASACGGDGGSPPPAQGGVPTPAPAGPPPRTDTTSYSRAFADDAARTLPGFGIDIVIRETGQVLPDGTRETIAQITLPQRHNVLFDFDPASRLGRFQIGGEARVVQEDAGTTYRVGSDTVEWYRPGPETEEVLGFARYPQLAGGYVASVSHRLETYADDFRREQVAVVGFETVIADLPPSGVESRRFKATFVSQDNSANNIATFGADFPVEIDYGKDRLKAQIATVLPEGAASNRNITFDFEGKLDRSGQIVSGTLKDSSGAARAEGQVIGAFYGPYAAELNLFGKLVLADGRQLLVFFFQQP